MSSQVVLSLLSGLIAALVATFTTLYVEPAREQRRQKLAVVTAFMASRNDVLGDEFSKALNAVLAAFADCPEVLRAYEELHAALSRRAGTDEANARLVALWRAMSKDARLRTESISDAQFLRVMNPRA